MEFNIDGADFDHIAEAKIAETGTYKLALTRSEIKSNKAEDGTNFEFDLMIINDPEVQGITFTIYSALPKPGDQDKTTKRAQTYKDFKLDMLKTRVRSFGGKSEGSKISIPENSIVTAVVEKKFSTENRPFNVVKEDTIKPESAGGGKINLS